MYDYILARCTRDVHLQRGNAREMQRDYYRVNERTVIGCGEPPMPTSHRRSFATLASLGHWSSRSIWEQARASETCAEWERKSSCYLSLRIQDNCRKIRWRGDNPRSGQGCTLEPIRFFLIRKWSSLDIFVRVTFQHSINHKWRNICITYKHK